MTTATRSGRADSVTIIEPPRGWIAVDLRELWRYRELIYFLTWRDVKVRYKQTALGIAWAVMQPVFTMIIFSLFFGRLGGIPSDGVPYPVFTFAALVPWTFFVWGLGQASGSVINSQHLIRKVYFPRLAIPLATVLSGVVDFVIAFVILLAMMIWYGIGLTPRAVVIIPLSALTLITALGVGLWLSALNVKYRDVQYAVPFLTQVWLYVTPIAYPASLLPEHWRAIFALNPMVGVVEGFRWALLGVGSAPGLVVAASSVAACAMLVGGAYYFRRMEVTFADTV